MAGKGRWWWLNRPFDKKEKLADGVADITAVRRGDINAKLFHSRYHVTGINGVFLVENSRVLDHCRTGLHEVKFLAG